MFGRSIHTLALAGALIGAMSRSSQQSVVNVEPETRLEPVKQKRRKYRQIPIDNRRNNELHKQKAEEKRQRKAEKRAAIAARAKA